MKGQSPRWSQSHPQNGRYGVVCLLLKNGAKVDSIASGVNNTTPLMQAARGCYSDVVSELLRAGMGSLDQNPFLVMWPAGIWFTEGSGSQLLP